MLWQEWPKPTFNNTVSQKNIDFSPHAHIAYLDVGVLWAHVCIGQLWEVPQVQDEELRVLLRFRWGEDTLVTVLGPAVLGSGRRRTSRSLQQVLLLELLESLMIITMTTLSYHLKGEKRSDNVVYHTTYWVKYRVKYEETEELRKGKCVNVSTTSDAVEQCLNERFFVLFSLPAK